MTEEVRPLTVKEWKQLAEYLEATRIYCIDQANEEKNPRRWHSSLEYKLYYKIYEMKTLLEQLFIKQHDVDFDPPDKKEMLGIISGAPTDKYNALFSMLFPDPKKVLKKYRVKDNEPRP